MATKKDTFTEARRGINIRAGLRELTLEFINQLFGGLKQWLVRLDGVLQVVSLLGQGSHLRLLLGIWKTHTYHKTLYTVSRAKDKGLIIWLPINYRVLAVKYSSIFHSEPLHLYFPKLFLPVPWKGVHLRDNKFIFYMY